MKSKIYRSLTVAVEVTVDVNEVVCEEDTDVVLLEVSDVVELVEKVEVTLEVTEVVMVDVAVVDLELD